VSTVLEQEKFEDTKGVIWSRYSKKLLLKYALQCKLSYVTFLYFPIGVAYYITSRKVCGARGIEKGNNFVRARLYTSKMNDYSILS